MIRINTLVWSKLDAKAQVDALRRPAASNDNELKVQVQSIIDRVIA